MSLIDGLEDKGYSLYTDSWYSSVDLAIDLSGLGFDSQDLLEKIEWVFREKLDILGDILKKYLKAFN